ncbi:FAD-dependent oxidoreductase [[Eubacterium] cellulosolvens]
MSVNSDVQNNRKIVIIGLGVGGLYAAKSAMNTDRRAEVTIIECRDYDMFSACGLPFAIEGVVADFESLKFPVPGHLKRLTKYLSHEVIAIDVNDRFVTVKNLQTEETFNVDFDALIIATGAEPILLPVPGAKELVGKGIHFVTNPENAQQLKQHAQNARSAVVIGGGGIGLEIAVALKSLGLEVVVTKRSPPVLPRTLDPDMGQLIEEHLKELGIRTLFGKRLDSIQGTDKVEAIVIEGETIQTDLVVMAAGVRAHMALAQGAKIACSKNGIITNNRMETDVKNIYAIGDCIETFNLITSKPYTMQLATSAYQQGIIAGINAAGGAAEYPGALGTFVSKVGKLEVAATGFNTTLAQELGYDVLGTKVTAPNKPEYMPDHKNITVKILADKATGRILGGQAIGEVGAAWRVNIISMAIRAGMDIQTLNQTELAYSPPVSEVYDVISMVTEFANRRLKLTK